MRSLLFHPRVHYASLAACIALLVILSMAPSNAADDQGKVATIKASDIPERAAIIGILGKPLGEVANIRGKWYDTNRETAGETKLSPTMRFRVSRIDGNVLAQDVKIDVKTMPNVGTDGSRDAGEWDWRYKFEGDAAPPKPFVGEVWEMLGYETGEFYGESKDVSLAIQDYTAPLVSTAGFGFRTHFKFFKMRKVR